VTSRELTTAAAKLRDGSRFDGQLIDADNPDLLRHCADLFRLRLPLAAWLDRAQSTHQPSPADTCNWCFDGDWPCIDMQRALAVARAINGGAS
jgi:hypothetical protein